MAGFIEEQARAGDPGARRLASSGAPGKRRHDDLRYLEQHRAAFELALQTTQ